MSLSRVQKLLTLAASAALIGSHHEAVAATLNAARIAERSGLDIHEISEHYNVNLLWILPWTEEQAPAERFSHVAHVACDDGSTLLVYEAPCGIYIERMASEADDYHYLGRGFWRDCEPQEAVLFAREAWGC